MNINQLDRLEQEMACLTEDGFLIKNHLLQTIPRFRKEPFLFSVSKALTLVPILTVATLIHIESLYWELVIVVTLLYPFFLIVSVNLALWQSWTNLQHEIYRDDPNFDLLKKNAFDSSHSVFQVFFISIIMLITWITAKLMLPEPILLYLSITVFFIGFFIFFKAKQGVIWSNYVSIVIQSLVYEIKYPTEKIITSGKD